MALSRFLSSSSGSARLLRPFSTAAAAADQTLTTETSIPYTMHNIGPPSRSIATSASELLTFFNDMALMHPLEIAVDFLYMAKLIRGFCHLYDGQGAAITKQDAIITAYRDHCIFLGRGDTLVEAFAELMGRRDGYSKCKGRSMHFCKKDAGSYGGHVIVGAQVPFGCGITFVQKYNKEETVTVTFAMYGDEAANQGQLFEVLNMAPLWDCRRFWCAGTIIMEWGLRNGGWERVRRTTNVGIMFSG